MNRPRLVLLAAVLPVVLAGCRGLAPPSWFRPGTAEYKQAQAEQFDPYPENEPAPEIVGARPLEYEKPVAEVRRVQSSFDPLRASWLPWNWGRP